MQFKNSIIYITIQGKIMQYKSHFETTQQLKQVEWARECLCEQVCLQKPVLRLLLIFFLKTTTTKQMNLLLSKRVKPQQLLILMASVSFQCIDRQSFSIEVLLFTCGSAHLMFTAAPLSSLAWGSEFFPSQKNMMGKSQPWAQASLDWTSPAFPFSGSPSYFSFLAGKGKIWSVAW